MPKRATVSEPPASPNMRNADLHLIDASIESRPNLRPTNATIAASVNHTGRSAALAKRVVIRRQFGYAVPLIWDVMRAISVRFEWQVRVRKACALLLYCPLLAAKQPDPYDKVA